MVNCYISFVGTTLQFETEVPDSVLLLVQFAPIYLKCLRVGSVTFCYGPISPGLKVLSNYYLLIAIGSAIYLENYVTVLRLKSLKKKPSLSETEPPQ